MRLVITGILTLIIFIMVSAFKNDIQFSQTNQPTAVPELTEAADILFNAFPKELIPYFHFKELTNIPLKGE